MLSKARIQMIIERDKKKRAEREALIDEAREHVRWGMKYGHGKVIRADGTEFPAYTGQLISRLADALEHPKIEAL